jgi:hypothetical protein
MSLFIIKFQWLLIKLRMKPNTANSYNRNTAWSHSHVDTKNIGHIKVESRMAVARRWGE